MKIIEKLEARGHEKIRATHPTTFEFTTEPYVTFRGDCIVGVKATKSASQLSPKFKVAARKSNATIYIQMEVDGIVEEIVGKGYHSLTFTNPRDLVVRKSKFACGRTLAILSNKAAADLSRRLIDLMKNPKSKMEVHLVVKVP